MTTTQAQMQELHEHEHDYDYDLAGAAQEPLPEGWTEHVDSSGATYYHNAADGATSWVRPSSSGAYEREEGWTQEGWTKLELE